MKKFCIGKHFPIHNDISKLLLIMKLSFILLFIIVVQATADVFSQSMSIDVKNKTMREVLKIIESQSKYRFFYNDQLSGLNQTITLTAKNKAINELLDQLLADQKFAYSILVLC
jgi:TonB-dependent starch-binding outer membrane protein SusC